MPRALHRLPAETSLVFSSPAELVAHHNQTSVEEAEELLSDNPPGALLLAEIRKLGPQNFVAVRAPSHTGEQPA